MRVLVTAGGLLFGLLIGGLVHGPSLHQADFSTDSTPAVAEARQPDPAAPPTLERPAPPIAAFPDEVQAARDRWREDGRSLQAIRAIRGIGEETLAEDIERIDALRRQGRGALLQGDLEGAEERWAQAIRLESSLQLGRPSAATFEMRRSLAAAWHERALAHEERGQVQTAWEIWQHATAIDPAHMDGLAGLQRLASRFAWERPSTLPEPRTWPQP